MAAAQNRIPTTKGKTSELSRVLPEQIVIKYNNKNTIQTIQSPKIHLKAYFQLQVNDST